MSGGKTSGVDLARVALRSAMEAVRKNGDGQKANFRVSPANTRTMHATRHSAGMTATSDRLDLPARRRQARLIAALTTLIGACAEAAGAVYQPIAAASPGQEAVEVNLLPCLQVSLCVASLLDLAREEDQARWPAVVAWERQESRRTYAARCAVVAARTSRRRRTRPASTACRCRRWSRPPQWTW
ncbi:hypothetical protein ABZ791_36325 [Streptomyces huasconensis]|uniref:Uncharacterized protein n=1 Tax=Streptomyces huasconensis TaxID=1854574 RepID=A0ABV3M4M4_9ACTN